MQDLFLLCSILIPLFVALVIVLYAAKNGIGPSPTTERQRAAIFKALPAEVRGKVYELGSGWGGLAASLARHYPGCSVIGVENSPVPYFCSLVRTLFWRLPNLTFVWKDIRDVPLGDASLIVCYLHTGAMERLREKLEREAGAGLWIVSNTFSFHGWDAERTFEINDIYHSKVYRYHRGSRPGPGV